VIESKGIKITDLYTIFGKKNKKTNKNGVLKNPFFYFGSISFMLLGLLLLNSNGLASLSYLKYSDAVFFNSFFKNNSNLDNNDLFSSSQKALALAMETPDLKIIQDNFIFGVSTPRILTTQTLGAIFGDSSQNKKEVTDHTVQPGDTIESIAQYFNISVNTLLWANSLSKNSALKVGQNLTILPVSGVVHVVRSGDTTSEIAKIYKAKVDDIVSFNNLTNEADIFVGDILIVPDGVMPQKSAPSVNQTAVPDSFFIYPTQGIITQGLHYFNAVDLANKCGTPIYASATGTIQRATFNNAWNFGMGNYVTILHSGGISTYYGHLMSVFVKPGDQVNIGDRIGLMGQTGKSTGCHVHFQVIGGKNPLGKYSVGTSVKYK